jgi:hypothetical protein
LTSSLAAIIALAGGAQLTHADAQIYVNNENLERYLIQQGFDSGEPNGTIPFTNAQRITTLNLANMDIDSLTGIELFKNLEYIDVSGNDELRDLYIFGDMQNLKTFKATGSKIETFQIYSTRLEVIDFSDNRNIREISVLGSRVKSLNVTGATKLRFLRINGGALTTVDLSSQTDLDSLTITSNKLTSIDLSRHTKLGYVELTGNRLSNIDFSKNLALREFRVGDNNLTTLDVSKNSALEYFNASSNNLTRMDLSPNTRLLGTNLADNKLTSLTLPKSSYFSKLDVGGNRLKSLDVSGQPNLFSLTIQANQIRSLNLRGVSQLRGLNVGFNPIRKLLLNANLSALQFLDISHTNLKRLDLRGAILESNTTDTVDYWAEHLYNVGGVWGIGLWSHDTKVTLVVDNPQFTRAEAGHSIDDHVTLVRK